MMRIAFVGLGAMGHPMATRLSHVPGIELSLFDVDDARLQRAATLGRPAKSVADAVADADVVFTVLPADQHVRTVVEQLAEHGRDGQTFVDFSTIGPATILNSRDVLEKHGIATVGVALTRSTAAAAAGELVLFAGGLDATGSRLREAFAAMAAEVRDVGDIATAKAMKLANNMAIACMDVAICEAIVLGRSRGLTTEEIVEGLGSRGADSWPLRNHIERYVLPDDLGPGRFSTRYMAKDVALYTEMALAQGIPSVLAGIVTTQYRGTVAHGYGDHYHMIVLRWQELAAAVERRSVAPASADQRDADLDLLARGVAAVQALATEDALASVTATGLPRLEAATHLQAASAGNDYLATVIADSTTGLAPDDITRLAEDLDAVCALTEAMDVPGQMFELARRDVVTRRRDTARRVTPRTPSADSGVDESGIYPYLASLDVRDLDSDARDAARALILDHLGCALFGMRLPWTRTVHDVLGPAGGAGDAVIYGSRQTVDAAAAALINGTAAHAFDLDDTHLPTMSHPGAVVIAAAMAVGAGTSADGAPLIAAIAAGYEAMTRVARAVGLQHGESGYHPTSTIGPIGAAVAAARLLGADAQGVHDAVGVAASLGSGIKAFRQGPGMVKRLHAGRAAESGVLAARLAVGGFAGPARPLAGPFGLIPVYAAGGDIDYDALTVHPSDVSALSQTYIKPYPACAAVHGALTAAEALAQRPDFDAERITDVEVGTTRRVLAQNAIYEPTDAMSAQYSMPYSIASALRGNARVADGYIDPDAAANAAARSLARQVRLVVDDDIDAAYPDRNMGRVTVTLADGSTLEEVASRDPSSSGGWTTARNKFVVTTRDVLSEPDQHATIDVVGRLLDGATVADILAAVGG